MVIDCLVLRSKQAANKEIELSTYRNIGKMMNESQTTEKQLSNISSRNVTIRILQRSFIYNRYSPILSLFFHQIGNYRKRYSVLDGSTFSSNLSLSWSMRLDTVEEDLRQHTYYLQLFELAVSNVQKEYLKCPTQTVRD